jgi:hypothetical protein
MSELPRCASIAVYGDELFYPRGCRSLGRVVSDGQDSVGEDRVRFGTARAYGYLCRIRPRFVQLHNDFDADSTAATPYSNGRRY